MVASMLAGGGCLRLLDGGVVLLRHGREPLTELLVHVEVLRYASIQAHRLALRQVAFLKEENDKNSIKVEDRKETKRKAYLEGARDALLLTGGRHPPVHVRHHLHLQFRHHL